MPNVSVNSDATQPNKTRIIKYILLGFVVLSFFTIIFVNNLNKKILNKDEIATLDELDKTQISENTYVGKVVYVDARLYPQMGINYLLEDSSGATIALLKARDEKLAVVEGLNVTISGKLDKTITTKEDVIIVDSVTVVK